MGLTKRLLEEHEQLRYSAPRKFVCHDCVEDQHLEQLLAEHEHEAECSYCGADDAADISVLLDAIQEAMSVDYTDPAEELPYDGSEGGYQGSSVNGSELAAHFDDWTQDEDLFSDACAAFVEHDWCRRNYGGLDDREILQFGWEQFCRTVKYETRYVFSYQLHDADEHDPSILMPGKMLDALGKVFQRFKMFSEIEPNTALYRVRVVDAGERPSSAVELGTAPADLANMPNRMSPAGIPMFYGALEISTALAETWDPACAEGKEAAISTFRPTRTLRVLDLTTPLARPSPFDKSGRGQTKPIEFLQALARDFSKPVARDLKAHVEYVPTQIVTEFVRRQLHRRLGEVIDGVKYCSSKTKGCPAIVVFADSNQCGPRDLPGPFPVDTLLSLEDVQYIQPANFPR